MNSLEDRGLCTRIHTYIHTHAHSRIHIHTHTHYFPGENSRHYLHFIRKSSNFRSFYKECECTVYFYSYHLLQYHKLKIELFFKNIMNYVEIVLYIQCGMITWYKVLVILLCSVNT